MAIKIADLYIPGGSGFVVADSNDIAGGIYTVDSYDKLINANGCITKDNDEWNDYVTSHYKKGMFAYISTSDEYYQYRGNKIWTKTDLANKKDQEVDISLKNNILTINGYQYDLTDLLVGNEIVDIDNIYIGCVDPYNKRGDDVTFTACKDYILQASQTQLMESLPVATLDNDTYVLNTNGSQLVFVITVKNAYTSIDYTYTVAALNNAEVYGKMAKSTNSNSSVDIWFINLFGVYQVVDSDIIGVDLTLSFKQHKELAYYINVDGGNTFVACREYINKLTYNNISENGEIINGNIVSGSMQITLSRSILAFAIPQSYIDLGLKISLVSVNYQLGVINISDASFTRRTYEYTSADGETHKYTLYYYIDITAADTNITYKINFN